MKSVFALVAAVLVSANAHALSFDSAVPANIKDQMLQDLGFVATVQGTATSPLHQQIFGAVDGAAYKNYFETRVLRVGMNACGGGNAVACVIPFFDNNKMWLTQNYIRFSHPQIARLMVVFHEARHTERNNGNWGHANCPTPFLDESGKEMRSIWTGAALAGEAACDETPRGSYGSSTIMLWNVSKACANCGDKVKMDAEIYANDQFGRIIDSDARNEMKNDRAQLNKKVVKGFAL